MNGLKFDFNTNDVELDPSGQFLTATIDNQNVALIAISQVCRLTAPQVGAQIASRLINRPAGGVASILEDARSQAKKDGAKNVKIGFTNEGKLTFSGRYED